MTRWLVTGAGGQLGRRAVDRLTTAGAEVVGVTRADLDVTSEADVARVVADVRPDVVLNAAAYTAVDAAETDVASAEAVNVDAPRLLARALRASGGRLMHVSTDFVFDGTSADDYDVDDPINPQSVYGRTKADGEAAVRAELPDAAWVVRTAWVYGGPGPNFVDTMVALERSHETLDVVADQVGSPTWVCDLADGLIELAAAEPPAGVYHFANAGSASRAELAREVFRIVGADPARVRDTTTDAMPRPAVRPARAVLSLRSWTSAGLTAPRDWREALVAALAG